MPLTPEDVVSKRFNSTKFREGYDQDEVDDFLDEVVVELRRLNAENDELKQRLIASEARINELQRNGGGEVAAAAPVETVAAPVVPEPVAAPVVAPEPVPVPVAEPEPVAAVAEPADETASTNDLLKLARRLHDQHVQEGIEKRDQLISEGHSTAAKLVSDAQEQQRTQLAALEEQKRTTLSALEEQKRTTLGALEEQKSKLEGSIDQLRSFETEYRTKLRSYIEGQLDELTHGDDTVAPTPAPAAGESAPAPVEAPRFATAGVANGQQGADRPGLAGDA
jgi:DivIVA domain-containing protein